MNLKSSGRSPVDSLPDRELIGKPNRYWRFFESHVNDVFGQIAEFDDGRLIDREKFEKCYVSEFYADEIAMMPKAAFSHHLLQDCHADFENLRDISDVNQLNSTLVPPNRQKIILLLGDIGIGKTCLVAKFMLDYQKHAFMPYANVRGVASASELEAVVKRQVHDFILHHLHEYIDALNLDNLTAESEIFEAELRDIAGELASIKDDDAKAARKYAEIGKAKTAARSGSNLQVTNTAFAHSKT